MSIIEKAVGNLNSNSSVGMQVGRKMNGVKRKKRHAAAPSYDMVEIDQVGLRSHGIDWDKSSSSMQEFQKIKRPLLNNMIGDGFQTEGSFGTNFIVVTSAVPGEGKTHTSLNLAMSLSYERDYDVLFVDGDTIKRDASLVLGLSDRPGLNDLLNDHSASIDSHIVQTDVNKLKVLPAGSFNDNTCELLSSERMNMILAELLEAENRIVLFDAPPMLATVEASVLTRLAGQVVVVTEAAKTSHKMVQSVLDQIEKDKPVGMVLNKSKKSHGEETYGSYYENYRL
ncbi:MAG: AAA family ATPase [Gammaproteobacteria bacterium]|nr:AAA family ATPase [Gammaproteobacteria bacterium]